MFGSLTSLYRSLVSDKTKYDALLKYISLVEWYEIVETLEPMMCVCFPLV